MLDRNQKIEVVEEFLKSKHVTLWGPYDVVADDSRRLAAEWFLTELEAFDAFITAQADDETAP
jgi:hypothetical protein